MRKQQPTSTGQATSRMRPHITGHCIAAVSCSPLLGRTDSRISPKRSRKSGRCVRRITSFYDENSQSRYQRPSSQSREISSAPCIHESVPRTKGEQSNKRPIPGSETPIARAPRERGLRFLIWRSRARTTRDVRWLIRYGRLCTHAIRQYAHVYFRGGLRHSNNNKGHSNRPPSTYNSQTETRPCLSCVHKNKLSESPSPPSWISFFLFFFFCFVREAAVSHIPIPIPNSAPPHRLSTEWLGR